MSETVYSQDYTGRRYFYGCKRPVGIGHYPTKGLIIETPTPGWVLCRPFGIVLAYTRKLTQEEIAGYELMRVNAHGELMLEIDMGEKEIEGISNLLNDVANGNPVDPDKAFGLRMSLVFAYNAALREKGR